MMDQLGELVVAQVRLLRLSEENRERLHAGDRRESSRSILRIRDDLVPFLSLDTVCGIECVVSGDVVKTIVAAGCTSLVLDERIGGQQTVIKSLSLDPTAIGERTERVAA